MTPKAIQKLAPAFWIGAGVMMFLAAFLGKQVVFAGIGAMFIFLGFIFMVQARKADKS